MDESKITVLAGHYGSGKTTLAQNLCLYHRERGRAVVAADLDIINPYFRLSDGAEVFAEHGIPLLSPRYAGTNVDIPAMIPEFGGLFQGGDRYVVADAGGDDTGAAALGRYSGDILSAGYEMLLVANKYRPLTGNVADTREMIALVEGAAKIPFTGIAANPNLGRETDAKTVLDSLPFYRELARETGLSVRGLFVREDLAKAVAKEVKDEFLIRPVKIFQRPGWEIY